MVQNRTPTNRKAMVRCVLVAFDPDGQEHVIRGEVQGVITPTARGTTGFGYDPVFAPVGHDKTFAELGAATKNQISHRAVAIRELLALLPS